MSMSVSEYYKKLLAMNGAHAGPTADEARKDLRAVLLRRHGWHLVALTR